MIEMIIVPGTDKKISLGIETFWVQLTRMTKSSIAENLEQPR